MDFLLLIGLLMLPLTISSTQQCSEVHILTVERGATVNISTPNYPQPYSENQNCEWHIQVEEGSILQLEFLHFHLIENVDFLTLSQDGNWHDDSVQFTGIYAPRILFSYARDTWLHFISKSDVPKEKGFLIEASLHKAEGDPSCRKEEYECGTIMIACFKMNTSCPDATPSYRPPTARGIQLHHSGRDNIDLYENMSGHVIVNVILGVQNTFTCIIKESSVASEITWSIGGEEFKPAPGGLVVNSDVLVAQSSVISNEGLLKTTGTFSFIPTLEQQGMNLTCTGRNTANTDMGVARSPSLSIMLNILAEPRMVTIYAIDPIIGEFVSFVNGDIDSTLNIVQGKSINISCEANDAEPNASLFITINGASIDVTEIIQPDGDLFDTKSIWTLWHPSYREFHNALLQCTARNSVNPTGITAQVKINVLVPVTNSHMELSVNQEPIQDSVLWLESGNHFIFQCLVRNVKPIPSIRWNTTALITLPTPNSNHSQSEDGLWNALSTIEVMADLNHPSFDTLTCTASNTILSPTSVSVILNTLTSTEGSIKVHDISHKRHLQDGDVFIAMENIQSVLTCTAGGWLPLPSITWSVDGNKSTDERVSIQTDVSRNMTISYFTFEPDLSFHKRSVVCTVTPRVPHQQSVNSSVVLHVYSVPPSNTSLNIFNQAKQSPFSSEETLFLVKGIPQEFKCIVVGTRPEAFIQWIVGDTEKMCSDEIISPSASSQLLVDTTSVLQIVPTLEHHLQRLTCKTLLPMSGKAVFNDLILYVSDTLPSTIATDRIENSSITVDQETISPIATTPLLSNPLYMAGLGGLGFVIVTSILFLIVIVNRRRKKEIATASIKVGHPQDLESDEYCSIGFDFPLSLEKFHIVKELNNGSFCSVFLAMADGIQGHGISTEVAVKKIKENSTESEISLFKREITFSKSLKSHANILGVLGCNIQTEPYFMVTEHMAHGNLRDFLLLHSTKKNEESAQVRSTPEVILSNNQLIQFARDVASGMAFLATEQIIHRDLAARNVLIDSKLSCRVSDFGLACHVSDMELSRRFHNETPLPIRWMAPEALLKGVYTEMSDVWSYGIVLWEVFSMGEKPYPGIATKDVVTFIQSGNRLLPPRTCEQNLCNILASCWDNEPDQRPRFNNLVEKFDNILDVEHDYLLLKFVN